ncbi:hypothetical protein EPUS_02517 [Endocarpon pusillum Z07020]|uniref:Carboxylesterase family protein n=1 Tax=Endocarpon pusillum (strain Z07020 / HMAS-L-300199) TaxID=1263415 RepID=U1GFY7_ENDPU|nr:uncharacterized protein EPUS_02517 [Endocarpon pusillum Z07020]ERF70651.1 hypothetical protein EPUS_02517 [Endocarpon pusillum Z07020]
MPRVTRAQLRAQEAEVGPQLIHEDNEAMSTTNTQDYDPFSSEISIRPPLGEIQNNNNNAPLLPPELGEQLTPTNKNKGTKKSNMRNRKNIKLTLANDESFLPSPDQQVLEDESQSDASSAAEAAAEELRRDSLALEISQVLVDNARPVTPSSTAAKEASRSLSKSPEKRLIAVQGPVQGTPRFDPLVHSQTSFAGQVSGQRSEDSFVSSIKTRTPARIMTSEQHAGDGPDSFMENIINRSPSKYVARIEDSVEAIDALEEAIEQVAEDLPKAMPSSLESPVRNKTPQANTIKPSPIQGVMDPAAPLQQTSKNPVFPTKEKLVGKTPTTTGRKPLARASSAQPQPRTSTLTTIKSRSSTQPTASAATTRHSPPAPMTTTAPRRTASTSLSTSKPGFVPIKSAKPPTKSNFSLPGDAISAKMKAQREERLKKEEEAKTEEARKRTEFKARPVPRAVSSAGAGGKVRVSSVLPRENATSRARMSLIIAKKDEAGKDNAGPAASKVVSGSGLGSARAGGVARKSVVPSTAQSSFSVTNTRTRPSVAAAATITGRVSMSTVSANSAVRRNTTHQTVPSKTRQSSIQTMSSSAIQFGSEGSSNTNPATTARTGKMAKGKEIFSRGKLAEEDLQKQKREKEAAAKKARAEAAERGRLASREWAEKQRVRKLKRETLPVPGNVDGLKMVGLEEAEGQ